MKKNLLVLAIAVLLIGCSKFEEPPSDTPIRESKTRSALAAQDNPYSLTNVQMAMDKVSVEMGQPTIKLKPTHYYVRFLPKDSTEYTRLLDSSNLMLFTYPLDRELTDEEVEFFENDTTNTYGYPWHYTKVPTDYIFPDGIIHEILDEVVVETFDDNDINAGVSNKLTEDVWDRVMIKSMRLPDQTAQTRSSYKWRPYASVRYVDDFNGQTIPLVGVRVRCHHLLHFEECFTNANGEATSLGSFKQPARYKIFWEDQKYWDIRDGLTWQAKTKGPRMTGRWELVISGDTEDAMFAAIHRACRAIFHDNPFGITRPKRGRIKLCAFYKKDVGKNGDHAGITVGIWPDIRIFRKVKGNTRSRWEITSTALHELGHASHHRAVVELPGSNRIEDFVLADGILKESWARGIQFAFMNWLYPNQVNKIRPDYFENYTGVVEGLMNQGLTLKQIEGTVVGNRLWRGWRRDVKALHLVDDIIVDMIFDNPYMFWAADFKNLIIGTSQIYTDTEVTYSLPQSDKLPSAISNSGWTVSGEGYTIIKKENRSIKLRFNTLGERTLTAHLKLIDGTDYDVIKKINVTSRGTIYGSPNPHTGEWTVYRLSNYTGTVDKWEFEGLPSKYYWIVSQTSNSVTVVFKSSGSATIKAKIQNSELATKSIKIPTDMPINSFCAYKNTDWPYDFWIDNVSNYTPNPSVYYNGSRTLEPKTSKQHFMAYGSRPSSSHPNYSLLKPIYENGFHHGKYAYDQRTYPEFSQYGIKAWVFSSQRPGTVPLYLSEDSQYKDKKMVYTISYLTQENLGAWRKVSSWYWNWLGTRKKGDRNWTERKNFGVMGYVYPYIP